MDNCRKFIQAEHEAMIISESHRFRSQPLAFDWLRIAAALELFKRSNIQPFSWYRHQSKGNMRYQGQHLATIYDSVIKYAV